MAAVGAGLELAVPARSGQLSQLLESWYWQFRPEHCLDGGLEGHVLSIDHCKERKSQSVV